MRDKDVRKPSRSCDEPGRRRFCWLGNLQGAGAFAAKQACCSRGSSNVSGAPRLVGRTDLASSVVGTRTTSTWGCYPAADTDRMGSRTPSEQRDVRCRQDAGE